MSGVAGGNRIQKQDVDRTFTAYYNKVLKNIPGFKKASLSGSVKAGTKPDYGDLDLIVLFDGEDKREVKQRIIDYVTSQSDSVIVPFKSPKYSGRKYYNAGELISVLFPIQNKESDQYIQIDNIIALDPTEHTFKGSFLDLPAEKQGLLIGLAKVIFLEEPAARIFKKLGIKDAAPLEKDEEYEFNLSSNKLTLRKVKLDNYKEVGREELWSTTDWNAVDNLFSSFKTDGTFEQLLSSINRRVKNPRSKRRIAGVFKTMVTVKSGEQGTPKGDAKVAAIGKVDQVLTEAANNERVGLYGGGFKPPHKGHFKIAYKLAEKVDRLIIFIGPKIREGQVVTPIQSEEIWKTYSRYLPVNDIEIRIAPITPIRSLYEWVDENQDAVGSILVGGVKGESAGRFSHFIKNQDKYPKVQIVEFNPLLDAEDEKLSASYIRTKPDYLEGMGWAPEVLNSVEQNKIKKILKKGFKEVELNENMSNAIEGVLDKFKPSKEKQETKEGSSGTPIAAMSAIPSKDRNKLVHLYNHLQNILYKPDWDIDFQQDKIVISKKDPARISYDYTPYMGSLVEYMLDQGMKITPLPEIKIRRDVAESVDFFGKTAYYDTSAKEIVLYVEGRHPKDVMRSFVHEMIHHMQNLEGRINNIQTSNTNEDGKLNELEQEAYLKGNITFRNWEDKIKNESN